MAEGPVGEFFRSYPTDAKLHWNKAGQPLVNIPCHDHPYGHMRVLYASDTPGPDGRLGWEEIASSPIKDAAGNVTGWHEERNHIIRGNGPDSARWLPKGWRHEFYLLSMSGYHECYFHFVEPSTGENTPLNTGYVPGFYGDPSV